MKNRVKQLKNRKNKQQIMKKQNLKVRNRSQHDLLTYFGSEKSFNL